MQIHTRKFGPIQFTLEEVLVLPDGLLDFPDEHRWLLLADRCHADLYWLQSLDTLELAIAAVQPSVAGIAGFASLRRSDWVDLVIGQRMEHERVVWIRAVPHAYHHPTVHRITTLQVMFLLAELAAPNFPAGAAIH